MIDGLIKVLMSIAHPFRRKSKDLGCADHWVNIPKEVIECMNLNHKTTHSEGRTECIFCNYFYMHK